MSFCVENLISKKFNFCILQVSTKNSKAINLYENLNFFKINYLNNYYIGERDSDAFLMGKFFLNQNLIMNVLQIKIFLNKNNIINI